MMEAEVFISLLAINRSFYSFLCGEFQDIVGAVWFSIAETTILRLRAFHLGEVSFLK